jgi:hypothetical protein
MRKKARKIIFLIAIIAVFGWAGYEFGKLLRGDSTPSTIPMLWLLSLLPVVVWGIFLVIFLHELGHAIAGYVVGFKFRFLTVGPFMWEKSANEPLTFKWNKSLNISGGLTLCLPESGDNLRYKFALFGAGGPLMSLFISGLFYIIYVNTGQVENSFWSFFLSNNYLIISILSFFIFLITIIPFHSGGFYSDGARVLTLLRGGEQSLMQVVLLTEMSRSISGVRPRDLDKPKFEQILPLASAPAFVYTIVNYLYFIELDQKNYPLAYQHLQNLETISHSLPVIFQKITYLELAYFEAAINQNAELAQIYLHKVGNAKDPFIYQAIYLKTEAALALIQQKYDLAIQKAEAARQELGGLLEKGQIIMQSEMIDEILSQAKQIRLNV